MENKTDYQSMEASYYESTGTTNLEVQRRMVVELTSYHTGETETKIKIKDCLTSYEWEGNLEKLLNQLVKSVKP